MSDSAKFWFQSLMFPAALAVVGYFINNTLQERQRELDRIKLMEQIVSEAFDSENPAKAMALSVLILPLTKDEQFASEISSMINDYYTKKAIDALNKGNDLVYLQISDAAKAFEGTSITISDSLQHNPMASKAEKARTFEQDGLKYLQLGDLSKAKESFQTAEKTYPGFHSSYEISNLLSEKLDDVKTGKLDSSQAKEEVISTIKSKYAWKINPAMISKSKVPQINK